MTPKEIVAILKEEYQQTDPYLHLDAAFQIRFFNQIMMASILMGKYFLSFTKLDDNNTLINFGDHDSITLNIPLVIVQNRAFQLHDAKNRKITLNNKNYEFNLNLADPLKIDVYLRQEAVH